MFHIRSLALTVGRQELALNDGRFLSFSNWRQVHGTFDAARVDAELPLNFSFTYAFINRTYRVVGYNATDGKPPMHTDMMNLKWSKPGRINAALYGLLLDYRAPAQFAMSTQTYGLRLNGPYQFNDDWSLVYTAEYAKQKNYGTNPNRVDANYYLGEIGPGWREFTFKAGYAFLGGRSATDKLTTPLAPPFNGWTDLFVNNPSAGGGNGLEARYLICQRANPLAGRSRWDADLLRLPLGLSAHPLWQRAGFRPWRTKSSESAIAGKSAGASAAIGRITFSRPRCARRSIRVLRCESRTGFSPSRFLKSAARS